MGVLRSWSRAVCCAAPENTRKGNWSGMEFHLVAVGFLLSMGSGWTFSYQMYRSGGVAFLVPFVFWMLVLALPLVLLELYVGQYSGQGVLTSWGRMTPVFSGIGYAMMFVLMCLSVYYAVYVAYALFYVGSSFDNPLPWTNCDKVKSALVCNYPLISQDECKPPLVPHSGICFDTSEGHYELYTTNFSHHTGKPVSVYDRNQAARVSYSDDELPMSMAYFKDHVGGSSRSDAPLEVLPYMCVCLLLVWVAVAALLCLGHRSLGKVAYVTTLLPFAMLGALQLRMLTLPGSMTGMQYLLLPAWGKLLNVNVWIDAASRVVYFYGLGLGVLQTLASYNRFNNDIARDSLLLVLLVPLVWSLSWSTLHFSAFGFLASEKGVPIEDVATAGAHVSYNTMAEVFTLLPRGGFWAAWYYITIFLIGLSVQLALVQTISTSIIDAIPKLKKAWWAVTPCICLVLFLLGIPLCLTKSTSLMLNLDMSVSVLNPYYILITEFICVGIYGVRRYREDLSSILGQRWAWCIPSGCCGYSMAAFWYGICPVSILFVFSMLSWQPSYFMPGWPLVLFHMIKHLAFFIILLTSTIWFGVYLCRIRSKNTTRSPGAPAANWGPEVSSKRNLVPHLMAEELA